MVRYSLEKKVNEAKIKSNKNRKENNDQRYRLENKGKRSKNQMNRKKRGKKTGMRDTGWKKR